MWLGKAGKLALTPIAQRGCSQPHQKPNGVGTKQQPRVGRSLSVVAAHPMLDMDRAGRNASNSVCKKHGLLSALIWERKSEFSGNFGTVTVVTASRLSPGGEWEGERQQEEQGYAEPAQVEV